MTDKQILFNREAFEQEYLQQKRYAVFRLQELIKQVNSEAENMEFTEDQTSKLDRLKSLNLLLHNIIEDFENNRKV